MNLTDILKENAKKYPSKTALVMRMWYRTVFLTYQEVYELAQKIAIFLEKQALKKGDKVLLLAPNSPYWICVFWGCLLRGAVLVPLNIQSTSEIVKKIADQTEARLIFKYRGFRQALPRNLKSFDIEFIPELVADEEGVEGSSGNDLVEIIYTSGTTGEPKGVMLTHRNLYTNVQALAGAIPVSAADKFLSILPLSHIYEQVAGFLLPFSQGCEIVYAHSPAAIRDLLFDNRITMMAAVPEFLQIMMSKIESRVGRLLNFASEIKSKAIRRLILYPILKQFGGKFHTVASGGAPLDPNLEMKWAALGIDLLQGYGLTETSPIISCNTYQDHRLGSVGKILPAVQVKLAADGEILIKGPNVFGGYFKNEEKTREAFTLDGWFKTGDIGEIDKDGFLFLQGRKKYMILGPGGQNVYPEDLEFELNRIPGVKDSCVVGLEKPGGQVEIYAVLLLQNFPLPSAGEEKGEGAKIVAAANKKLASYQQITDFSIWPFEDFPRSATRKVKKEEVLKFLRAESAARPKPFVAKTLLGRLLAEITGTDMGSIREHTQIVRELNLDSLLRIELVARIEEKFGITLEETKITPSTTVGELQVMLKTAATPPQKLRFKTWPLSWWARFLRWLGQTLILFPLWRIFVKLEVGGQEFLRDLKLPAVFMPNHLSYLDSLVVLMALPGQIRKHTAFAAAQDVVYGQYRGLSWVLEVLGNVFPFSRREQDNIKLGLEYFGRMLDKGYSIIIYPEGRQSLEGKLLPLKRGAGLIATEMACLVVPVKISGTNLVQPPNRIWPRKRGAVRVKFGKPLKFHRSQSYLTATETIQKVLEKL